MIDISFDGPNRLIILGAGVRSVSVQELYSQWKVWAQEEDNTKYLQAIKLTGGESIGNNLLSPAYYFLMNGWLVRPDNTDHSLTVGYNLYADGGGSPFTTTIDMHQVVITNMTSDSPMVQLVGGSGLSTEESAKLLSLPSADANATAVWEYTR